MFALNHCLGVSHQQNKYTKSFERNCMPKYFRKIAIDAKDFDFFEIFRNISKYFEIKIISKDFEMYCEILQNRANKNNATLYLIIPSGVAGRNILHIIALFRNISQNFKIFLKK